MNRAGLLAACSLVAVIGGCALRATTPRDEWYGPPVAPAEVVTIPATEEALYFDEVPAPEQGEGGPDEIAPEPWQIPAGECTHVRGLLARHDLIGPTAERLVWLAMQESDCGAYSVNAGTGDYGIWQVNWSTWAGPLCRNAGICTTPWELAHDDDLQAEIVAVLLDWQGWSAWCWSTPDHHARGIGYECPWGVEEQG